MAASLDEALDRAARLVGEGEALLICTGAGMGVDSGLGTFRGKNAGVWPPLRAMRVDFSEMSCPRWFQEDPRLAWAFWHFRHQAYTKGSPHVGYSLLAQWGSKMRHGLFSVTSNIDGHWIRTEGVGDQRTFECHGAVTHMQHVDDIGHQPWETNSAQIAALQVPEWDLATGDSVEVLLGRGGEWVPATVDDAGGVVTSGGPMAVMAVRRPGGEDLFRVREGCQLPCDSAGKALRPNVLMFGDWGVNCSRIDEQESRFEQWKSSVPPQARLVVVEVGAGTAVSTIRRIAQQTARDFQNAAFIRVNLEDSAIDTSLACECVSIGGLGALEALTRIDALLPRA